MLFSFVTKEIADNASNYTTVAKVEQKTDANGQTTFEGLALKDGDKDKVYIKILTYEFEDEYVSFRIFSQGEWKVKLITE